MTFLISGNDGGTFPSWTTATRPASPAVGQMGYNTTPGQFDAYTSNGWVSVATSATAPVIGASFSYYADGTQSVSSGYTKMLVPTKEWDTANTVSSSRFTPTVAGYYQINGQVSTNNSSRNQAKIYKNGVFYKTGTDAPGYQVNVAAICYANGTTDYFELWCYSAASNSINGIIAETYFQGFLARAA